MQGVVGFQENLGIRNAELWKTDKQTNTNSQIGAKDSCRKSSSMLWEWEQV